MKLTVKECAKLARVSQSTIYGLLRKNKLDAKRFGANGRGCWRIEPEDFQRWMDSCRVDSGTATKG